MKFGMRKPSLKKSIRARTTGKLKRQVKSAVNPLYGKKGMGYIKDPKKAVYNKIYNKTTFGVSDVLEATSPKPNRTKHSTNNSINTQNKKEDDNMKNILNYIPGFRTKKIWKMAIAIVYYFLSLMVLTEGFYLFIFMLSFPFIIMGIVDFLKTKKGNKLILSLIGVVMFIFSFVSGPDSSDTNPQITPSPTVVVTQAPTETPVVEETPLPTEEPTPEPTDIPATEAPTEEPVYEPTEVPIVAMDNSSNENTTMVWIGETGTKYHKQGCDTLKNGEYQITLNDALAEGREPCKRCYK